MAVNINIPSQVSQTITDGVTDKAPSENAVNDALALKANTADLGATAFSNDYNDLDNLPTIPSTSGFVPYTGATNDLDMGTYNVTADHISLNVSPSGAGFNVGSTQWNNTIGSSETLLKGGNVTLKNGVDLVARIVNKVTPNTTLTKANYQAVKVSGATGGRLSVGLAQANTDLNSADTIGLVTETIATNQEGFIMTVGQLDGINTTGSLQGETWADGDVLYLSPTTAGRLTNVKPTGATGHIVVMGYVEYAHANNGSIYVKIMNGWELDELHNVYITNPTGGATLEYQASTQLWIDAGIQYTIELVAALTVDFYAPYNMVITSVSNVLNAPTITLQDDGVAYTLGNTIAVGSKVTVTASTASVVNLNITK
jgi:nitrogen fixation protein